MTFYWIIIVLIEPHSHGVLVILGSRALKLGHSLNSHQQRYYFELKVKNKKKSTRGFEPRSSTQPLKQKGSLDELKLTLVISIRLVLTGIHVIILF